MDSLFLSHSALLSPRNSVTGSIQFKGERFSKYLSRRNNVLEQIQPLPRSWLLEENQKETRGGVTHKDRAGLRHVLSHHVVPRKAGRTRIRISKLPLEHTNKDSQQVPLVAGTA